jgi:hypothetical protein
MDGETIDNKLVSCSCITRLSLMKRHFTDFGEKIVPEKYIEVKQNGQIVHLEKCHIKSILELMEKDEEIFHEITSIGGIDES